MTTSRNQRGSFEGCDEVAFPSLSHSLVGLKRKDLFHFFVVFFFRGTGTGKDGKRGRPLFSIHLLSLLPHPPSPLFFLRGGRIVRTWERGAGRGSFQGEEVHRLQIRCDFKIRAVIRQ